MIQEGARAPEFELADAAGQPVRLDALRGRFVVLYFYPRDSTPGCTREATDFRDLHSAFSDLGAVVLGVSPDGAASHRRFAEKHALAFPLLVDEEHRVAEAYGVWKQKTLYGRQYWGIERTTFLIGPDGRVLRVWPRVRVAGHAGAVLAALQETAEADRTESQNR